MKTILRNTLFYSFILYLLPFLLPGVSIDNGLVNLLVLGFTLMLLYAILRPVLNLISLPLNVVTIGLFSVLINAFLLYLLTVIVPSITISQFTFPGVSYAGFVIPQMNVSTFFAFVISAVTISILMTVLNWVTE